MAKNKIADLRDHLFETLERLKDDKNPMELERGKTIALVGQTIINSAVAETKFLEVTGDREGTSFFDETKPALEAGNVRTIPARTG